MSALIGDSAIVSIRLKVPHRSGTADVPVQQSLNDSDVIEGSIEPVVRQELWLPQQRPADPEYRASRRDQQGGGRRPAIFAHHAAETRSIPHPLTEGKAETAAEAVRDNDLLGESNPRPGLIEPVSQLDVFAGRKGAVHPVVEEGIANEKAGDQTKPALAAAAAVVGHERPAPVVAAADASQLRLDRLELALFQLRQKVGQ